MTPAEKMRHDTIDTVARTAYGEARGEGEQGMHAVINVIMNRAAQRTWYGQNPVAVCKKAFQFSCFNKGDANLPKLLAVTAADPSFATALKLATLAVEGELHDLTHGADHYYALSMKQPPVWARKMRFLKQLGGHRFYKAQT